MLPTVAFSFAPIDVIAPVTWTLAPDIVIAPALFVKLLFPIPVLLAYISVIPPVMLIASTFPPSFAPIPISGFDVLLPICILEEFIVLIVTQGFLEYRIVTDFSFLRISMFILNIFVFSGYFYYLVENFKRYK